MDNERELPEANERTTPNDHNHSKGPWQRKPTSGPSRT
jgi:hypothetical protein